MTPTPPTLHTRDELAALMTQRRPALLAYVRSLAPRWDDHRSADLLQDLYLEVQEKIDVGEPFVTESLWQYLCWLARCRVIDEARRREPRFLLDWRNVEPPGASEPSGRRTPGSDERRAERKQALLSEILQEYCRECETDRRRLVSKATLERSLRGQTPQEIVEATGDKLNTVEQRLSRERKRLFEMLQQHADAASLFATLLRKKANALGSPLRNQPRQPSCDTDVPADPEDLPGWLMDAAAAMCPTIERLRLYREQPADAGVVDLDFHIRIAACPLCAAELARLRAEPA